MVTWILFNVTNHQDVQERLHQEITSVLEPGQLPTFPLLQKMPFLKACVKESLRCVDIHIALLQCINQIDSFGKL